VRATLPLDTTLLKPGMRLAVGLSGGADSVALLRALDERKAELGLVLHAAHLHHGLRGEEADEDLESARALAATLEIPFHETRVDAAAEARAKSQTIEEAARHLRYAWFRQLMASGVVDAVATAHTRDDQAETVLAKFLRGAWTEGLSGIHPVLEFSEGRIVRPLLGATRAQVEAYLRELGQSWREDSSNRHLTFTRNRIRHELLPLLEGWNPRLREHLAGMAALARDEEIAWQAEIVKIAPQLILPGRPVRGGGRAASDGLAIDITRLAGLLPALQRRLLRRAADLLGTGLDPLGLDFDSTEALRGLALSGKAGQKLELAGGLRAERTPRELRLFVGPISTTAASPEFIPEYTVPIPGEVRADRFGIRLRIEVAGGLKNGAAPESGQTACLRNWKAGDRVWLRYSGSPRKVKEVLERMKVTGSARALWPVLVLGGHIVWMQGVELEPEPALIVTAETLGAP
jgi:tRNA(Ile)-lysidine synthase